MRIHKATVGAVLTAVTVMVPLSLASAGPSIVTQQSASSSTALSSTTSSATTELVVFFVKGSEASARQSIAAAGAQITGELQSVGAARVTGGANLATELSGKAGIRGVVRNHSIGTVSPGMPHKFVEERAQNDPTYAPGNTTPPPGGGSGALKEGKKKSGWDPFSIYQWDMKMIGATPDGAHAVGTGKGVLVGVIDTGIDASHPDLAANFDAALSRNFTTDIPEIDGPCEQPSCIDPANVDEGGHGTHVAGTIAAATNGIGISGVAPSATLVNLRAGQDSGYFFLFETLAALEYAGNNGINVVNMSFYTDPWLYNCDSADDIITGTQTAAQIAEQGLIKQSILAAVAYARSKNVTLVAAAGNEHTDLAATQRADATSPDFGAPASDRLLTRDCLDLPAEAPGVIEVSSIGPTKAKSDFSNYGQNEIDVAAPGGFFRDGFGTADFRAPSNLILSSYPLAVAQAEGAVNKGGGVTDADFFKRDCAPTGVCGYYTYLQGTSMASPHVAGVVALIVGKYGTPNGSGGFTMTPDAVYAKLTGSATPTPCPTPPTVDYSNIGRTYTATCVGDTAHNGFYGFGIVNALAAVQP